MAEIPAPLIEALKGRYLVERELGRGGMATVYLAQDLKHERPVALKVLRPELSAVLGRERFLSEIRLTAKLNHPGILTLLDSGNADGALYYTLPFVSGGSLRQRLQRERHLPIEEAARIGCLVAEALDHAHAQGIIHRDIKPENILLQDGNPVLTDFGIALAVREAGGERLTETGLVVGTPQYMSPEQATGERQLDGRSDLYSLGAVIYETLTGEPPVLGVSAQAIIVRLLTTRPTPIRLVRDTVSEGLARVVDKSLAKVPADRYASGAALARALRSAPLERTPVRTRRAAFLAGGAVLAAAAVLAAKEIRKGVFTGGGAVSPDLLAVLPATTSTPDSGLSRLARDLVYTLTPSLNGAGAVRAVDPDVVLKEVGQGTGQRPSARDLSLAQRLGAGAVVRSTLVRVGSDIRWDLTLLSSDQGQPLATATITAPAESIRAFTDTATRVLLSKLWERSQPPSPSLDAAVRTRSVPALKAFLAGEAAIVNNRWGDGIRSYSEAITQDSTFWLAYWRLWYSSAWSGAEVDTNLFVAARVHRAGLPDRERLLIEACTCVGESLHVAIRLAKQAAERFPNDWFASLFYGDYLVHAGPVLGYTAQDARTDLERTVAQKPDLIEAWDHLMLVSLGKDTLDANRAFRALDTLGHIRNQSRDAGYDTRLWWRLATSLQGTDGLAPHPLIDSLARAVAGSDSAWGQFLGSFALLRFGFPGAQADLNRLILADSVNPRFRLVHRKSQVLADAMRGAWDSALAGQQAIAESSGAEPDILFHYQLAAMGAWLGGVDLEVAVTLAESAHRAVARLPSDERAEEERVVLTWLDGLVAVARRDRPALARALDEARRSRAPSGRYIERSLRGFLQQLDGSTHVGDTLLAAADGREAWDQGGSKIRLFVLSVNRLAEARAFLAAGDTAQAQKMLVWHVGELNGNNLAPQFFAPFAYSLLAQVEQAQGQVTPAREHYRQFLRRYDQPVPRLEPMVEQARTALASLRS